MPQREFGHAATTTAGASEEFATMTVTIPVEEVTRLAGMQVGELTVAETTGGSELRSATEALVAVATERTLRDGSLGSEVRYRVAPADRRETQMATEIRAAVSSYRS